MLLTNKFYLVSFVCLLLHGYSNLLARGEECKRNGIPYKAGMQVEDNCNKCTCKRGRSQLECSNNICLIQERIIRLVNTGKYGWKAGNYSKFWKMSLNEGIKNRLGSLPPEIKVIRMSSIYIDKNKAIPTFFDARQKWPKFIHPVRDQGNCGACWAFSTTDVIADRVAIETNGVLTGGLSNQHLISCNTGRGQNGCDGGYVDKAWQFIRHNGLLTEDCYKYKSGYSRRTGKCMSEISKSKKCPQDVYSTLRTTPPYRISSNENEIMTEIMRNGPVQATMRVKEDFFMYKSGIYSYSGIFPDNMPHSNTYHSVRIIGWGEEKTNTGRNMKYWLCANSWGRDWGERGFFRIQRGNKDSNIESFIVAAHISKLEVAPSTKTLKKLKEIRDSYPKTVRFPFRRHFFVVYRNFVRKLQRRKRAKLKIAIMKEKKIPDKF